MARPYHPKDTDIGQAPHNPAMLNFHIKRDQLNIGFKDPFVLLAQGLGSGCIHPMPGTWGTFSGLIVYLLAYYFIPAQLWHSWVLAASVLGIPLCTYAEKALGDKDPSSVVWDEWCGLWIAYFLIPFNPVLIVIGFLLFRVLDTRKPWLIGIAERKFTKGYGIMLDDILAGVAVNLILQLLFLTMRFL